MSGGVDSSAVAWMLHDAGHPLVGLFMRNGVADKSAQEKSCCSASDARDAAVVADRLGMPFYAVDYAANIEEISPSNTVTIIGSESETEAIVPMASPSNGFYRIRYD